MLTQSDPEGHWHRPFVVGEHRHADGEPVHTHDVDGYSDLIVDEDWD